MAERCEDCGIPLVNEDELDEGRCEECTSVEHEDEVGWCDCEVCRRVRARYARAARERDARELAAGGGFSAFGREMLGWQEGDW